jgi:enterochelin esterase family protein
VFALTLTGEAAAQAPPQPTTANSGVQRDTAKEADFLKPVPHGELRLVWYPSKAIGEQRRMHVWLPPGYAQSSAKYPVLYLVHGGGQNDSAWTEGFAPYILDNLLAAGEIKPMIVVMPNGNLPGGGSRGDVSTPDALAAKIKDGNAARAKFVDSLMGDTIPFVEKTYRVVPDRNSRAIAGFSLGGSQVLWASVQHLDQFAWVGIFSMGIMGGSNSSVASIAGSGSANTPAEFVAANPQFFANPNATNQKLKLFWIASGSDDGIVTNAPKQLDDTLTAHGIKHEYHLTEGGHGMGTWRGYLRDFSAKLFR